MKLKRVSKPLKYGITPKQIQHIHKIQRLFWFEIALREWSDRQRIITLKIIHGFIKDESPKDKT
jgi:hypothetical protein